MCVRVCRRVKQQPGGLTLRLKKSASGKLLLPPFLLSPSSSTRPPSPRSLSQDIAILNKDWKETIIRNRSIENYWMRRSTIIDLDFVESNKSGKYSMPIRIINSTIGPKRKKRNGKVYIHGSRNLLYFSSPSFLFFSPEMKKVFEGDLKKRDKIMFYF